MLDAVTAKVDPTVNSGMLVCDDDGDAADKENGNRSSNDTSSLCLDDMNENTKPVPFMKLIGLARPERTMLCVSLFFYDCV
jgi:hypothetical protein